MKPIWKSIPRLRAREREVLMELCFCLALMSHTQRIVVLFYLFNRMHIGRSMYEVYRAKLGDKRKQSLEQQA